jgi:hypothetical protein
MTYYYQDTEYSSLPPLPDVSNPGWADYYARGWREVVPFVCPPGYVRKAGTRTLTVVGDVVTELWDLRTEAEVAAEAAAAHVAYMEGFDEFPRSIRVPSLEMQDGAHVYSLVVDGEAMEPVIVQRESTRLTNAELAAAVAAEKDARRTHRQRIAAIQTDLDQVEAALDQIDVTTTGTLGVAIAATAGANKTALQEVRKTLVDFKVACKNLRQAAEKLRREVR